MNSHIFIYRLKTLIRDKEMVFWTILFPIILASLFRIAFANINTSSNLLPISVAVIQDDAYVQNTPFKETLNQISQSEDPFFTVTLTTPSEAEQLLSDGKVYGIIRVGNPMKLEVASSGIRQSVIRSFLDQFSQSQATAETILSKNPAAMVDFPATIQDQRDFTREMAMGRNALNQLMVFYFALLAMSCFYGGYYGLMEAIDIQANLSNRAARMNLSPVHKLRALLSSASASVVLHFTTQLLLLAFLRFVLLVDFNAQLGLVIFTTFIGSILSISLGAFIGTAVRGGENIKNGIVTSVTMIGAFLAGLMFPGIKQIIAQNLPFLTKLNPVGVLADAYYSLYFFTNYSRFQENLFILLVFTVTLLAAVYLLIRRRSYDSL